MESEQHQPSCPAAAEPPTSSRTAAAAAEPPPPEPPPSRRRLSRRPGHLSRRPSRRRAAAELQPSRRPSSPSRPSRRAALLSCSLCTYHYDPALLCLCDRADGLSLFDLTSGLSPAPPATADSTVSSQWATRDAAARLAVRRHLPTTERAHFSQYRSAQTLYDAVVARYSSPATAALSRLFLPYLFPDLAAFPTVADLITHLRTSDARYRTALPAEDHFLSVCPTTLTVDLLEERLLAAEQSIVAVGASRGDPRTPIFEGCSPSPLLPSVASAATADLGGFESVGAASAPSGGRRTGRGKGGRGARWGGRGGGGGGGGSGGSGGGSGGGGGGGEQPRSPPVLYVDNKAMLALCREHRLEHRTKHIALRYFLARELQQRGQLRLAYVASEANTADIFTKALAPGDHQRFCTLLPFFA
ncbi:unnamed protein product [Closterium sp. NIES-53]